MRDTTTISDKTKVTVQIGGAITIAAALLIGGKYWGSSETETANTKATLARHEVAISELNTAVANINSSMIRSEASIKAAMDASNRADGKGTAILLEMATLRESLASRGINLRSQQRED